MAVLADHETRGTKSARKIHPPVKDITELLVFRLARLTAVNDKTGNRSLRSRYDISLNEWRILGLTYKYGPVRIGLIGDILLMDKGQLSRLAGGLITRNLLDSQPARNDARLVELTLTDEGKTLHAEILKFLTERTELVVAPLSSNEFKQFSKLLQKMSNHTEDLMNLEELV